MKKRILFINNSLGGGGAERILIDILRNFDHSAFEINLMLIYGSGVYMNDIPSQVNYLGSIHPVGVDIKDYNVAKVIFTLPFEYVGINRLVTGHYDTIVSFLEGDAVRYHRYIRHKANKNISWIHIDFSANHWSKECFISDKREKSVYESMDKVIFVSKNALNAFRQVFKYSKDNLFVINNPIDKERIERLSLEFSVEKDKFTFVAVGRLVHQKRYDRMLRAVKILYDCGCEICLNIFGSGELENKLKDLARVLDIDDVVKFYGFVRNPYPYIKNADALLLSSDAEGFPTVICEAMTLGVPVIGTNVTGTNDLIGDSEYGLLTNLTPESFANAMYQFYQDTSLRIHFANMSLERAKCLSVERSMKQIYSIL